MAGRQRLVVQMLRGLAGKKKKDLATLHALGIRRRNQVREFPNDASVRGNLHKVSHMLKIWLKEDYDAEQHRLRQRREQKSPDVHDH